MKSLSSPTTSQVLEAITDPSISNLGILGVVRLTHYIMDGKKVSEAHHLDFWSEDRKSFILRANGAYFLRGSAFESSDQSILVVTFEPDEIRLEKKFFLNVSEVENVVSEFLEHEEIEFDDRWEKRFP